MVIEHVMEQHEPVDFDSFLLVAGQVSPDDWRTTSEVPRGTGKLLELAAALNTEWTSIQSRGKTVWLKVPSHRDPPQYRDRVLQDWRAASMQSRQSRAMGKIAFFEMKSFLITAETAKIAAQINGQITQPPRSKDGDRAHEIECFSDRSGFHTYRLSSVTKSDQRLSIAIKSMLCDSR